MSSILTNNGATVALQTLKSVNSELSTVQQEIATGRKVSGAKDNSAVWAISKTMEADVRGFKGISESLTLGQATVSVARQGAETITELMTEIKGKIVAAQVENVDATKIQADIDALVDQVDSIASSASFNGMNLIKNSDQNAGSGSVSVLASLDRSSDKVVSSDITIAKHDLGTNAAVIATSGGTFNAGAQTATLDATQSRTLDLTSETVEAGAAFSISVYGTDANDSSFTQSSFRTSAGINETQTEMAASALSYVARDGDTATEVAAALVSKYEDYATKNGMAASALSMSANAGVITVTSTVTDGTDSIDVNVNTLGADAGNTIGGALDGLRNLDVTSTDNAAAALASIEGLIGTGIDAAAAFGSAEGRLETQQGFISGLSDAVKQGIGAMVDTDMEESSARLQALQVQQQLAQQALSIANNAPRSLLALFR